MYAECAMYAHDVGCEHVEGNAEVEDFGCVSVGGNSKIEDFEEEEDCGKIVLSEILFVVCCKYISDLWLLLLL